MDDPVEIYSADEKQSLLALARNTIEYVLSKKGLPDTKAFSDKLKEVRSCFVTLHDKEGRLKGCIGNIEAFEALADNVSHNAFNAAFRDPRFTPVSSIKELENYIIEISILTLPRKIASVQEFIVGKHGINLSVQGSGAVFLPQVALEQGWDRETTLSHLSMKAGLPADSWKSAEAVFEVFEAIVFSEKQPI